MTRRLFATLTICAMAAACDGDPMRPSPDAARLDSLRVVANPNMVVSALVAFTGHADSVRVRHALLGGAEPGATPAFPAEGATDTVAVLGLRAESTYVLRLVLYGGTPGAPDSLVSDSQLFTAGALPADLPAYTASGTGPLPGYIVFSATPYGLIIDRTGRVVWYKRFPGGGPSLNFMAQLNGRFVGRLETADPNDRNPMAEYDAAGFERRQLRCANNLELRFHDLLVQADGSYWIMCDDVRTMDLTAVGGNAGSTVTGTAVQHIGADGSTVLFAWTPYDHFLITDADSAEYVGRTSVNWTHGNSLDLDSDGNLLVSFRSLSEITKISTATGAVIWRLGGKRNQFTFSGAPDSGFFRQHNVRAPAAGQLILLDNVGRNIGESRYERYAIDAVAMTATLQQSYGTVPAVTTLVGGSVQAIASDRYIVSFGTQGRVEEFDQAGVRLWAIDGNPGYVFRAQRITSLYHPVPALTR